MLFPIALGFFADIVCDAMDKDLPSIDWSVFAATPADSWKNLIGEIGSASVGILLQFFDRMLCLANLFVYGVNFEPKVDDFHIPDHTVTPVGYQRLFRTLFEHVKKDLNGQ